MPERAASSSLIAVCMAGAARTLVHPLVLHTHRHHLLRPLDADLFAVVNLRMDTSHGAIANAPVSELRRKGTERWRVEAALALLGARVIRFEEDEAPPQNSPCPGRRGQVAQFWNIQLCGESVRLYETSHQMQYRWLMRTRPDTYFRSPVLVPKVVASRVAHEGSLYYCTNNDAFFVANAMAMPALFSLHDMMNDCRWVGNSSVSRHLPANVQCGLRQLTHTKGWIWPDCLMRITVWRYRLQGLPCADWGTTGRDFFRAYGADGCNVSAPCAAANLHTRSPSVFFPTPPPEQRLDADIYQWGLATGAIREPVASPNDAGR